jgi:hypothetical protein
MLGSLGIGGLYPRARIRGHLLAAGQARLAEGGRGAHATSRRASARQAD